MDPSEGSMIPIKTLILIFFSFGFFFLLSGQWITVESEFYPCTIAPKCKIVYVRSDCHHANVFGTLYFGDLSFLDSMIASVILTFFFLSA